MCCACVKNVSHEQVCTWVNSYGRLCKHVPNILALSGSCVRGRVFTDRTSQCSESATVRHELFLNLNFNFILCTGYHIWDTVWLKNATRFRLNYPNSDLQDPRSGILPSNACRQVCWATTQSLGPCHFQTVAAVLQPSMERCSTKTADFGRYGTQYGTTIWAKNGWETARTKYLYGLHDGSWVWWTYLAHIDL